MQTIQSNPALVVACKAFAKDHFAHFGCLPVEFEFADAVLDFDTYTGLLSKADLDEITGQDPERGLYPGRMLACYLAKVFTSGTVGILCRPITSSSYMRLSTRL